MDPIGAKELFDAQSHLYNLTFSYINGMSFKCAIELGIADIIHSHGRPITLPELVSALAIQPTKTNCLARLMRVLVHSGLFCVTEVDCDDQQHQAYTLTPASTLLLKEKPYCFSPYALAPLHTAVETAFHSLSSWFKGSETTAFEAVHGLSLWDYMAKNPEFASSFDRAIAADTQLERLAAKEFKPFFEGFGSLIDVGGGIGTFSKIISEAVPDIKCTVFDLPHVVANLPDSDNLKFKPGDMFQFIPSGDVILLKLVLHGFGDEECVKILKRCKEAIPDRGKVVIVDIVIDEKKDDHKLTETKILFDLHMMVGVTGKQRTENEWERLFLEAGFSHYKITPILGLRSLIEVYP